MKVINPNFVLVENKLAEARFFLSHFEKIPTDQDHTSNYMEATYFLSAFASSARSITFVLQKRMKRVPEFENWYEIKKRELQENRTAKMMVDIRNEIEKQGASKIRGSYSSVNKKGGVDRGWSIDHEYDGYPVEADILFICKTYFETLRTLVQEASIFFSQEYNRDELWSIEGLRNLGTDIREIEILYRIPNFLFEKMSEVEIIKAFSRSENIEPPTLFLLPSDRARRLNKPDPFAPIAF